MFCEAAIARSSVLLYHLLKRPAKNVLNASGTDQVARREVASEAMPTTPK
jgi:hypothetical protein